MFKNSTSFILSCDVFTFCQLVIKDPLTTHSRCPGQQMRKSTWGSTITFFTSGDVVVIVGVVIVVVGVVIVTVVGVVIVGVVIVVVGVVIVIVVGVVIVIVVGVVIVVSVAF